MPFSRFSGFMERFKKAKLWVCIKYTRPSTRNIKTCTTPHKLKSLSCDDINEFCFVDLMNLYT